MNSFTVLLLEFFFIALICASYGKNLAWFCLKILKLILNKFFLKFDFKAKESLLAVSVATNETDGYKRYLRSLKKFNYDYKVRISNSERIN